MTIIGVESATGAVAVDRGGSCCRPLSLCRCLTPRHNPVSSRRSPNPTGGFPALGSPVGSCVSHTEHPGNHKSQAIGLASPIQIAKAARLPPCDVRRVRCAAEPVDASTAPHPSSAGPSLGHVMLPGFPVIVRGNRQSHSLDPTPFGHRSSPESLFHKSSGGDFRRHTWSLAPSDPSHHEPTSGQLHPGQRTCHRPLYVLGKTTAAPHPREGSLHYPTT